MEMAQEEDETKKESAAAEKEMNILLSGPLTRWGHGVVRDPRGLQLSIGMIANGFTDSLKFNGYDD